MANSLPTNSASIGTAAAITSMILFDFSSISWRQHHARQQDGQEEEQHLADLGGQCAVLGQRRRTSLGRWSTVRSAPAPALRRARAGDHQPQLADAAGRRRHVAGQVRVIEAAGQDRADRRAAAGEQAAAAARRGRGSGA